jgi:hypothetical protein
MEIKEVIDKYIRNTWPIFPIYQFYEVDIPTVSNRIFVYNTLSIDSIRMQQVMLTKFFNVFEIYHSNLNKCVGNMIMLKNLKSIKYRHSPHAISACSSEMNVVEVERVCKVISYENQYLSLISYGNDAETITDLPRVMQIHLGEEK